MDCIPVSDHAIAQATEALASGGLVILPTDTVYGICADVRLDGAVRGIYNAKGKGPEAPLQLLFGDRLDLVLEYAELTWGAERLIEELGPGGWTIVTRAKEGWDSPALAGGRTVGVRMPPVEAVRRVVESLGAPLAASSANRHGEPSPTTCEAAVASVGKACALALDAGPTSSGIDSTVVDCSAAEPRILREGAIDRATIARILGLRDIPVSRSVRQ